MTNSRFDTEHILKDINGLCREIDGKQIMIHIDNLDHLEEILKLYDAVHLRQKPVREMLDRKHSNSFYRCGGIFDKPSLEVMRALMKSNRSAVATITQDGAVVGMLSMTIDMNMLGTLYYSADSIDTELFRQSIEKDEVFNPIDIVFLPKTYGLAYFLLYSVCNAFYEGKYRYWAVEIYTLAYSEENGLVKRLNDRNNPSTTLVECVGGRPVARLDGRVIEIEDVRIGVERNVFKMEMPESLTEMHKRIRGI